jgi:uncharacterized DUF497 family protein
VEWVWDDVKAVSNMHKHRVSFELAACVFNDPLALSRPDPHSDEERWQTIGRPSSKNALVLFVVHTWPDNEDGGRIISARRATTHERKAYEEGQF